MIQIVNVGPFDDPNVLGMRDYEVRINGRFIAKFQHIRANGLGQCLFAAARAVELEKWQSGIQSILNDDVQSKPPEAQ